MNDNKGRSLIYAKSFEPIYGDVDPRILDDARRHYEAASKISASLPAYGSHWQPLVDKMAANIPFFKSPVEALHFAQRDVAFDHRLDLNILQGARPYEFWNYDALLRDEFAIPEQMYKDLRENQYSAPESLCWFGVDGIERLVSNVLYWHFRSVLAGELWCERPRRILEIGGGYGPIARLWMMLRNVDRYVIVDIPESLFFAEIGLRLCFPKRKIGYFNGDDPGTPFLLVPIALLDRYTQPSDMVSSIGSMQEMTDEWADFYMDWLDRYDARFFYSLNYGGQNIDAMWESRTLWAPRPSNNWATRVLNPDVPLVSLQNVWRNFVETVYERRPAEGNMDHWSVWRGMKLTRATFLEGLDLLRQDGVADNARAFVERCMPELRCKELFYIARKLANEEGRQYLDGVIAEKIGDAEQLSKAVYK